MATQLQGAKILRFGVPSPQKQKQKNAAFRGLKLQNTFLYSLILLSLNKGQNCGLLPLLSIMENKRMYTVVDNYKPAENYTGRLEV